jgi:hypothetical protein
MKILVRPVGAELYHADRQRDRRTDMMKQIVALSNFSNAPKNAVNGSCMPYLDLYFMPAVHLCT